MVAWAVNVMFWNLFHSVATISTCVCVVRLCAGWSEMSSGVHDQAGGRNVSGCHQS